MEDNILKFEYSKGLYYRNKEIYIDILLEKVMKSINSCKTTAHTNSIRNWIDNIFQRVLPERLYLNYKLSLLTHLYFKLLAMDTQQQDEINSLKEDLSKLKF